MSLSRADLEARLMPYVDGELSPEEALAVTRALPAHPDLAAEAEALRALVETTRVAFGPSTAHAASVRFDGLADRVLAQVAPVAAAPSVTATSLTARLGAWWRGVIAFERPFVLAAAAAAVVAGVGTVALTGSDEAGSARTDGGSVATSAPAPVAPAGRSVRRGPEREVALGDGRGAVRIESAEVTDGRVFVEGGETEDKPLVLWHVVDGESAAAGGGL